MIANRTILGHEFQAMLDGCRVDEAIRGIAWKGRREGRCGIRDRRGHADCPKLRGEALEPRSDRNVDDDPPVLR